MGVDATAVTWIIATPSMPLTRCDPIVASPNGAKCMWRNDLRFSEYPRMGLTDRRSEAILARLAHGGYCKPKPEHLPICPEPHRVPWLALCGHRALAPCWCMIG